MEKLAECFPKYYPIGLQLGIDENKLDEFELTHQTVVRRFSAVISHWLKGNAKPVTWESLLAALKSRSVAEKGLAEKLEENYIVKSKESDLTPTQGIQIRKLKLIILSVGYPHMPTSSCRYYEWVGYKTTMVCTLYILNRISTVLHNYMWELYG